MVLFEKSGGSRLVQVRALGGDYPFYGKLETIPKSAEQSFRKGKRVLVDKTLMLQFDAQVGDQVHIGNTKFVIDGTLAHDRKSVGWGKSESVRVDLGGGRN